MKKEVPGWGKQQVPPLRKSGYAPVGMTETELGGPQAGAGGAWTSYVAREEVTWRRLDGGGLALDQAVKSQQYDGPHERHDKAGALPLLI
jgi:hypothetical protein